MKRKNIYTKLNYYYIKFMLKNSRGFTLLELLLVLAIIIVLAAIVIYSLRPSNVLIDSKEKVEAADIKSLENAVENYTIQNTGTYPSTLESLPAGTYDICKQGQTNCTANSVNLDELVSSGILNEIPTGYDCTSPTASCYSITISDEDTVTVAANVPGAATDVFAYGYTDIIAMNTNSFYAAMAMDTDSAGNLFYGGILTGNNVDLNPTSGSDIKSSAGAEDIVLTKMNSDHTYGWSYLIGSSGIEAVRDIAVDSLGNIYVTGYFNASNVDFDPTSGTDLKTSIGSTDLFLTKINANGTYGWTYAWGSTGEDVSQTIEIDNNNNIYIGGGFNGTNIDMNPTSGTDLKSSNFSMDFFVSKFNANGTYGWTITMGDSLSTTNSEYIYGMTIDNNGNLYLSGFLIGPVDMNPFAGVDNKTKVSNFYDLFLTKINSDFTYGWTYTYGASGISQITGIPATDSLGNVYVAGKFNLNTDFDPTAGTDTKTAQSSWDVFLTKINANGTYNSTLTMGGTGGDGASSLAVDFQNNIYISSFFTSASIDFDPTSGVDTKSNNGSYDIAITRINSDMSYGWTYVTGGASNDTPFTVITDTNRNVYYSGYFNSASVDFNPLAGTDTKSVSGANYDYFITKLTKN